MARKFYQKISHLSQRMKKIHDYRFAEQIKAAAGSVRDNISEGFEKIAAWSF
ncbi:MAG: four helix bundle protein [Chitinophagaceae bacterium]